MATKSPRSSELLAGGTVVKGRKSRFGCSTCKSKRLKCDESKPNCKQCLRRNLTCPGYETRYRWSTRHERTPAREKIQVPFLPEDEYEAFLSALPKAQPNDSAAATHESVSGGSLKSTDFHVSGINEGHEITDGTILDTPMNDGEDFNEDDLRDGDPIDVLSSPGHGDIPPSEADDSFIEFCEDTNGTPIDEAWLNNLISETWDSMEQPDAPRSQQQPASFALTRSAFTPPMSLNYNPVHLPTVLVEHWFSDVCPMWSAFDSPNNRYRQLACTAWQHSESVLYTLQSMSASYLVDSLPHLKKTASLLSAQAVRAIQTEASTAEVTNGDQLPSDLLLAIFAMGTSVCWSDTRQLGLWFLAKAQALLSRYAANASQLDEVSYKDLLHFREALVYWEMLSRVVGRDSRGTLKARRDVYKERIRNALRRTDQSSSNEIVQRIPLPLEEKLRNPQELTLHPWTGVSTNVQHLFGLILLLCRENRDGNRQKDMRTTDGLSDALCDIELARDFEAELQQINVRNPLNEDTPGLSSRDTGDSATPVSHLIDTAEAYRLAALLQLYQTFPELRVKNATGSTNVESTISVGISGKLLDVQRERNLLQLTFQLVECLQRIPAESGTRCIQPLLYISAASGLRFDTCVGQSEDAHLTRSILNDAPTTAAKAFPLNRHSVNLDVAMLSDPTKMNNATRSDAVNLTDCTLEVSRARRFVVNRLHALQRSLPPRPVGVALELVRAIWASYDHNTSSCSEHWIDVMVDKGLETLFG